MHMYIYNKQLINISNWCCQLWSTDYQNVNRKTIINEGIYGGMMNLRCHMFKGKLQMSEYMNKRDFKYQIVTICWIC